MEKFYLPTKDVFDRYEPRVAFNLIHKYHEQMTEKHDWFVREFEGDSYYVDGELPIIPWAEIINCNWTQDKWDKEPFSYYYNPNENVIYKEFRNMTALPFPNDAYGENKHVVKKMRGNDIYFMHYKEGWGGRSALWDIDNDWIQFITKDHIWLNYYQGKLKRGKFINQKSVKNFDQYELIPILRKMNHKKFNGFYDEFVNYVVELFDVNRTQI